MTKYLAILRGVNVHSIKEILLLKDLKKIPNIEKKYLIEKKLSAIWDVKRPRKVLLLLLPYDMKKLKWSLAN